MKGRIKKNERGLKESACLVYCWLLLDYGQIISLEDHFVLGTTDYYTVFVNLAQPKYPFPP